ncbi:MAG: MBL fold metallo-hydrolase [Actinomycetota bacterium]|nr:MBL fold metallo-hydrolase [Actinomycetota bacterium]
MSAWHEVREIRRGIWSVAEPSHVTMWLVAGSERAVLLDSGLGLFPVRPVVDALTHLPVSVVNTHYHFDHVGGNHEFDEAAIHSAGAELMTRAVPRATLDAYLGYTHGLIAGAPTVEDVDHDFLHLVDVDSRPKPLPDDFDPTGWTIAAPSPTRLLADGDTIDLGRRTLRVIHTPGHSGDSICLLDDESGILFGGDTINTGPIYAQFHDSDVATFASSTARLAELKDDVSLVAVNHFGRTTAPPYFLQEVSDGFARLVDGRATFRQAHDCTGDRVSEAMFDRFSIFTASPG